MEAAYGGAEEARSAQTCGECPRIMVICCEQAEIQVPAYCAGVEMIPRLVSLSMLPAVLLAGDVVGQSRTEHAQSRLPCDCRALGRQWPQGEEVCLDIGGGRKAYVCGMDQNVSSWKDTGRRCPES